MKLEALKIQTSELSMPFLLFLWGAWFTLADPLTSSVTYQNANFLPNWAWSLIFTGLGIYQATAIIFNMPKARLFGFFLKFIVWGAWFVIFATSNWHSHAVPTMLFFIYLTYISWQRFNEIHRAGVKH